MRETTTTELELLISGTFLDTEKMTTLASGMMMTSAIPSDTTDRVE
jgi:hypothetical protein